MTESNPIIYIYNLDCTEFLPKLQIRCVPNIKYHEFHLQQRYRNGRMEYTEQITVNADTYNVEKNIDEMFRKYGLSQKYTYQLPVTKAIKTVKVLLQHLQVKTTKDDISLTA